MEEQTNSFVEKAREVLEANVRWGKYLVIMGYFFTGLVVVAGLLTMVVGSEVSDGFGSFFLVFYLALAALYYLPIERLNRFVKNSRIALDSDDENALIEGLYGLSRAMRLLVIYTLIFLSFYGLMLLIFLVFGLSSNFMDTFNA